MDRIPFNQAIYGGVPKAANLKDERGNVVRDLMFETGVYAHEIPIDSVEAAVAHVRARVQELASEKLRTELEKIIQVNKHE